MTYSANLKTKNERIHALIDKANTLPDVVFGAYYDYVLLYLNGQTLSTNMFCALVICHNITSGSIIAISI